MQLETGLFDRIVLQRNSRNLSDAAFTGTCDAAGPVEARVTQNGKAVRGLNWKRVGSAARRKFKGVLKGVPTGGSYDIELRIKDKKASQTDTASVKDVLVGDVWIAAGQSNMQGCGLQKDRCTSNPLVRAFYMSDKWGTALDPIHDMWNAVDKVHANLGSAPGGPPNKTGGVGPAVRFAQVMHETTGVPQGILACAHGGTSMAQWDPAKKSEGTNSLYGATVRRLQKNGGKIAGVVWYQGESDANDTARLVFTDAMKKLCQAFRRDAKNPKLPIVTVQIGRVLGWAAPAWNNIQDQQRRQQEIIKHFATVPGIDLALDDSIHISGADQQRLGARLANAMLALTGHRSAKLPIMFKGVSIRQPKVGAGSEIVVEYDNVQGKLVSGSRPVGFSVGTPEPAPTFFDTQLEGNKVILRTGLGAGAIEDRMLYYGHGTDPVCNITDEGDRALPVMGPISLGDPRALTSFVRNVRVSQPVPSKGSISALKYPRGHKGLNFAVKKFDANLIDMHASWYKVNDPSTVLFFRCDIECAEPMKVLARLGYDGPVKLWVDGKEKYCDPKGTNPAVEDQGQAKLTLSKGTHEVLVALDSNKSKAWGIFLRFERSDVKPAVLKNAPESIVLPKLLG